MKIKVKLNHFAGSGKVREAGTVVEVKDDEAKKAIAAGYAEAVKEPESKAKKAATADTKTK